MNQHQPLLGKIALVAGATRGAGRGIARMLGEAGATVYCSGRSSRGALMDPQRPETIEETAELVTAAGGIGIAVRTDHSDADAVTALLAQIRRDTGRLDLLVNDIWGGDTMQWQPFWQLDTNEGFALLDRAVRTHIVTSRIVAPLMIEQRSGLIIEITDGDHTGYRGMLFYDLAKMATIRLAYAMSVELARHGVTALAVTPGFLRSEAMLENFGVSEANWRDASARAQGFSASETPCFVGRAVAALAADPNVADKSGKVFASWTLAREYGFTDINGERPDWGAYVHESITQILARGGPKDAKEKFWIDTWYLQLQHEPAWQPLIDAIRSWRAAQQQ